MKKLPDLYTNSFDKKIDNSLEYITIRKDYKNNNFNINKKIDNIFKSSNYIYKIKVEITLKDRVIVETIIGKSNNKLLTYNNDSILISDILDIREI